MLAQRKAPVHQRRPATLYAEEDRLLRGQARSSRLAQHNVHALERDLIFARAEQEMNLKIQRQQQKQRTLGVNQVPAALILAESLRAVGRVSVAINVLKKIVEVWPGHTEATRALDLIIAAANYHLHRDRPVSAGYHWLEETPVVSGRFRADGPRALQHRRLDPPRPPVQRLAYDARPPTPPRAPRPRW